MRSASRALLTQRSCPRPSSRRRFLPAAGVLAVLLAFQGCDVARVAVPMLAASHANWTRLTGDSVKSPFYPDWRGNRIVFSEVTVDSAVDAQGRKFPVDVFRNAVIQEDGSGHNSYPHTRLRNDLNSRWVTDNEIVFASTRAGKYDLWYMNLPDSSVRRLTDFPGNAVAPAPRPGAPGMAYAEAATTTLNGRIVLIPDTAFIERHYLTPDTLKAGEPDWDPAGNRVCFSAQGPDSTRHIWVVTIGASDTTLTKLTSGPFHDLSPRFSPDGSNIVFTSDRTGRQGVWVVNAAGEASGLTLVAFDDRGMTVSTPAWSPDGHRIVVTSGPQTSGSLYILSNTGF